MWELWCRFQTTVVEFKGGGRIHHVQWRLSDRVIGPGSTTSVACLCALISTTHLIEDIKSVQIVRLLDIVANTKGLFSELGVISESVHLKKNSSRVRVQIKVLHHSNCF